jgi:Tfp pilus assembly protein PilF
MFMVRLASLHLVVLLLCASVAGCGSAGNDSQEVASEVTFHRDVAPIIYDHCAACHRPDGSGPFSLLTYTDVQQRGAQIVKVTASGYMPPWLPASAAGEFVGDCRLSVDEIDMIHRWVAAGADEGNPDDSPPIPQFPEGWQLGEPDLIVEIPEPFMLPADGNDYWRTFVFTVPIAKTRYVRAVEIQPGSTKVIHHATCYINNTDSSRRLDALDREPGYDGMRHPEGTRSPEGHFLSWQPGLRPYAYGADMAWSLEPGTDLVLSTHMIPSGKPEPVRPRIGLYFTDIAPTKFPLEIPLTPSVIDIPPGEKNYEVTDSFTLPVDVKLLGLYPHAHLVCKGVEVWAEATDSTKRTLLRIPRWDFYWQNAYRFTEPVFLPKGTVLSMKFVFDNSADNPRNPNQPPRRVQFGFHTYDEMARLGVQVLPKDAADAELMAFEYKRHASQLMIAHYEFWIENHPGDAYARVELGKHLYVNRRTPEAIEHFQKALEHTDNAAEPHFFLGRIALEMGKPKEALREFEAAVDADPNYYGALGLLGVLHMQLGQLTQAEKVLERSLKVHPNDALAHYNLGIVRFQQNNIPEAARHFREAVKIDPNYEPARHNLREIEPLLKK